MPKLNGMSTKAGFYVGLLLARAYELAAPPTLEDRPASSVPVLPPWKGHS
jgi:hypothetical protein